MVSSHILLMTMISMTVNGFSYHILIWDTSKNLFEISSMEEEYRTILNFYRCIHIVESRIPSAPPIIHCRDDSGIHEFDMAMETFSIWISRDMVVDRLIINFRIVRTRSRYSTYTDNQQHGIIADMLTSKWGIGL